MKASDEHERIANEIADYLFSDGQGSYCDRLVQESDHSRGRRTDMLPGYCRISVVKAILDRIKVLSPAPALGEAVKVEELSKGDRVLVFDRDNDCSQGVATGRGSIGCVDQEGLMFAADRHFTIYRDPRPLPPPPVEKTPNVAADLIDILTRNGFTTSKADHAGAIRDLKEYIERRDAALLEGK